MKSIIRSIYLKCKLKLKGAKCGKNVRFNGSVDILLRDNASWSNIIIGNNITFSGKLYIRLRKKGKIIIKDNVRMGTDVWLVSANDAELFIDECSILGNYNIINSGHGLKIGKHCIFANFVYINSSDHKFKKGKLIQEQGFFGSPIEIGEDVWIGGFVLINKGVKIGDGSVIGAGSIVLKNIPSNSIVGGSPSKVIKKRE